MGNKKQKKSMPSANKNKSGIKRREVILPSCANLILPIALVLGMSIILHGHLTPGGGFQGGVLVAGAVAILYAAYDRERINKVFNVHRMKAAESIGALGFIIVASLGLVYGAGGYRFFANVIGKGTAGSLYSSGSIFWMNFAVGFKVLMGVGALILIMVNTLNASEE